MLPLSYLIVLSFHHSAIMSYPKPTNQLCLSVLLSCLKVTIQLIYCMIMLTLSNIIRPKGIISVLFLSISLAMVLDLTIHPPHRVLYLPNTCLPRFALRCSSMQVCDSDG